MPTESKWEAPAALVAYESGDLDSIADGGNLLGDAIDNVADGENEMFLNLEFYLAAQVSSRAADARVEVYILYAVDTNFDMGETDGSPDPRPETLLHVFSFDADTAARYRTAVNLPIAPFDFKLLVMNETGRAFASGNTLKYRLHSAESQ